MKHEMGVGVNVISVWPAYSVLLYGLHFNFASCVWLGLMLCGRGAVWPQKTATHMTMGQLETEPMTKHRKLACEIITNYIAYLVVVSIFRKLNSWKEAAATPRQPILVAHFTPALF